MQSLAKTLNFILLKLLSQPYYLLMFLFTRYKETLILRSQLWFFSLPHVKSQVHSQNWNLHETCFQMTELTFLLHANVNFFTKKIEMNHHVISPNSAYSGWMIQSWVFEMKKFSPRIVKKSITRMKILFFCMKYFKICIIT